MGKRTPACSGYFQCSAVSSRQKKEVKITSFNGIKIPSDRNDGNDRNGNESPGTSKTATSDSTNMYVLAVSAAAAALGSSRHHRGDEKTKEQLMDMCMYCNDRLSACSIEQNMRVSAL